MSNKDISLDLSPKKSNQKQIEQKNDKKDPKNDKNTDKPYKSGQKDDKTETPKDGPKSDQKNISKPEEKGKEVGRDISPVSARSSSGTSSSSSSTEPSNSINISLSPTTAQQLRSQSIQTLPSSSGSEHSAVTLESLKYLHILDQYVSGQHWDLDIEYILNTISGVIWSLLITFFIFYDIDDNCWHRLVELLSLSIMISAVTAVELTAITIVWYLSLVNHFINRSRICAIVIVIHIITAFINLLMAVIDFGSRTCDQWGELGQERRHQIVVKYEIKMIALLHCIVSVNLMFCAMLLAIKRNDFKFYVLWRKGLLNRYLLLEDD